MTRKNQIIERLERGPCTIAELPGKVSVGKMSVANASMIRRIRVSGRSLNRKIRHGQFQTVFYLAGDDDAAIKKFVQINADVLDTIDFCGYTAIDSGLNRDMAQRIRAAVL